MTIIRRLNCSDISKIKKMISYLGDDKISRAITSEAFAVVNALFPLKYKFLPESYILLENKEILGLITVAQTVGNPYKINITRLIFKQNMYDTGKQLVEFIIAKYGAKGAVSFKVTFEHSHDELLNMFINGCGFRHCSYENMWKLDNYTPQTNEMAPFRYCHNSDAEQAAILYNSELKNHYKYSLARIREEFKEPFFAGMTNSYKKRYILEENSKIISILSVTTTDNYNFIIDFSLNTGYDIPYDKIINFALYEISRRKSKFCTFLKHRQYTVNADEYEKYLHEKDLKCVQTQCILVKDFYKPIKQSENHLQIFQFGELSSN